MPADILIYALVAAGLVFWLRNILGTRHGSERPRQNPFAAADKPGEKPGEAVPAGAIPGVKPAAYTEPANPLTEAVALPKGNVFALSAPGGEAVLLDIARTDRGFHLGHFLTGAQDAFVMIVEAYAAGNRDLLKSLLAPALYSAFDSAISEREKAQQIVATEIHAIRKVEISDIQIKDKDVFITIRFVADETSFTRDQAGTTLHGNPDRVRETIDIWTFGRNIKSRDPTWLLFATREVEAGAMPIPS